MNKLDNSYFENRVEELRPTLFCKELTDFDIIEYKKNADGSYAITKRKNKELLESIVIDRGTSVVLDFGEHNVGYFEIYTKYLSGVPDSPVYFKFQFAQVLSQFEADAQTYDGILSGAWIQEEYIHQDVIPGKISLDRRYAFRYVKITSLAIAKSFTFSLEKPKLTAVTSADESNLSESKIDNEELALVEKVSLRTLRDCMQEVLEDSPIRDRRLWLGDLYLEAIANYATYKNYDIIKRCFYIFAANRMENGGVTACHSDNAGVKCHNEYLSDYALIFCPTLYDFYNETKDVDFVKEMWQIALDQIKIVMTNTDEYGVLIDKPNEWWSFIDWCENLNKQAPTQGLLIFALKNMIELAKVVDDNESLLYLEECLSKTVNGALTKLYDKEKGLFVSGDIKQPSKAAQIWMIIADILPKEENIRLFKKIKSDETECEIGTPFLMHFYLYSSYLLGLYDKTEEIILDYWGSMANEGADTFWEGYQKNNPSYSPNDNKLIDSYCHAWGCTPSFFIRKLSEIKK